MRPIPAKLRKELDQDPTMHQCGISNLLCEGRVEWHHVFIYAGRQINEFWAIVPACAAHHKRAEDPEVKRLFQIHSLRRATRMDLLKYPKKDWNQIKRSLKII